jgi:enamine deaminase RidA (YjgF/YER057c/UK114 family)
MPRSRRSDHPPSRRRALPAGERLRYSSGTPWEPRVGYSRAVRVGSHVYVSGTTATAPDGSIVGPGDPYRQTVQTLDNIERGLQALGSSREAIVRLRMFTTDIGGFDAIARALAERFPPIRPTMTLVEVRALVDPKMLIEIEADAEDLPPPPARRTSARRRPASRRR